MILGNRIANAHLLVKFNAWTSQWLLKYNPQVNHRTNLFRWTFYQKISRIHVADRVVYNCDSILLFEERHLLQRRRVSYYILLQFRNSIIDGIDGNKRLCEYYVH